MPTPKSDVLFERLVMARNRLNEITKQLNTLDSHESPLKAEQRRLLELRWDEAFWAFEAATKVFYAGINEVGSEPEAIKSA